MKNRLQFNRHYALFNTREEALTALRARITDPGFIPLIGEPMVFRYKDPDYETNKKVWVILAIGAKSGNNLDERDYHVIDTADLDEKIAAEVAAREALDSETIKRIIFDGVENTFEDNVATLSVSANSIPIGPYEEYDGRATKPHPIHDDYTLLEAVKQVDTNFISFLNDTEAKVNGIHIVKVTEGLDANVREAYDLVNLSGNVQPNSERILIYKDSALYNVYLGHTDDRLDDYSSPVVTPGTGDTAICFIYLKADSTYQLVAVNVEDFLQESEFEDGLEVNNHIVKVKIDESSEGFLTVSANGVKLAGVQDAINAAKSEEEARATAVENAIQAELDNTQVGAGLSGNGAYIHDHQTSYIGDANSLANADHLLDVALKTESDRATAAETTLQGNIDAEVARATAAEGVLQDNIDAEESRATSAETTLQENIDAEQARATASENTLQSNIDTEVSERANADGALQNELDSTQTGAGLGSDGSYLHDHETSYIGNAQSLANADHLLDVAVKEVSDYAIESSGALTTRISLEETRAKDSEDVLRQMVSEEVERATAAENTLQNNIDAEASTRANADEAIQNELDATQVGAGLKSDGTYKGHDSQSEGMAYITTATSIDNATVLLDKGIQTETDRATLAEKSISGIVNTFSAATEAFSAATVAEIARVDGRIDSSNTSLSELSASTKAFSANTVSEVARLDTKIEDEEARATAAENSISTDVTALSAATESFSAATVAEIARIDATATRNKVKSTGNTIVVTEATEGTNLEVNIDAKTILSDNGALKTGLKVAPLAPGELESNVREAFRLVDNEGTPVDNTIIKIYKSSSLVSVELINVGGIDYVRITYIDNEGITQTMDLNIKQLIFEAEFKDGLVVNNNGEVRVKIDPTSESFLTVSSEGVKISGIQSALDNISAVTDNIISACGLNIGEQGSYIPHDDTKIIKNAGSLDQADVLLDGAIAGVSSMTISLSAGTINDIKTLSGNVIEYVKTVSGDASSAINVLSAGTIQLSADTKSAIATLSGGTIQLSADTKAAIETLSGGTIQLSADTKSVVEALSAGTIQLSGYTDATISALSAGTIQLSADTAAAIEQAVGSIAISSTTKTILVEKDSETQVTNVNVNIDNDTIVRDKNYGDPSFGKLSVKLDVERTNYDDTNIKTKYVLKSSDGTYGTINDTRDIFNGDSDGFIKVVSGRTGDGETRTDEITITPVIQNTIANAMGPSTEATDKNGLATAWGVKQYVKDGIDGDVVMAGNDNLIEIHPYEYWRGKINFDSDSLEYDSVHGALYKTDNNMQLLDETIGLDISGLTVHQYPTAKTQDCLVIKDDRTVMDALVSLDTFIDNMDYTADTGESMVFTGLTQTNGSVEVTSENLTSRKLAGYEVKQVTNPSGATFKVATGDTLGQGLGKLQGQINAMDWTGATNENQVFTGITERDGLMSASCENIANVKLADYAVVGVNKPYDANTKVAATDTLGQGLGKLQGQINAMDWTGSTTENEVFTGITEHDGFVSATTKLLTAVKLSGYTVGSDAKIAATDTLGGALGKVQGQINAMDYTANTGNDKVITGITQEDGKVAVTSENITSRVITGYAEGTDADVTATDTLGQALGKLQAQINAMDYTANTGTDKVITGITQNDGKVVVTSENITNRIITGYAVGADAKVATTDSLGGALGKLQGQINAMDKATQAEANSVIYDVTETDGKVSATSKHIVDIKLSGYTVGADSSTKVTSGDTLGGALGKLQGQINGLDYSANAGTDKVITAITQTDGKVEVATQNITSRVITGYAVGSDAKIAETDTLGGALGKVQGQINAMDKSDSKETGKFVRTVLEEDGKVNEVKDYIQASDLAICAATVSEVASLGANVKEAYRLVSASGATTRLGEWIKIYKDSSIAEIYLGTSADTVNATTGVITKLSGDKESLNYVYHKEDGTYEMAKIDLEQFLTEPEFKDGLVVDGHLVKVKIDPNSETFLTVGGDGVKLSGVQNAINTAIDGLDSSSSTTGNRKYVTGITIVNGKITAFAEAGDPQLTTAGTQTGNVLTSLGVSDHQITLDSKNVPEAAFTTIKGGTASIAAGSTADTITFTGSTPIIVTGNNKTITVSHSGSPETTKDAGSGNYIQKVTLDSYGHVVGLTTGNCVNSATSLANKPVLAVGTTDTNKITVKAGEKTSDEFTVPYATNADTVDGLHFVTGTTGTAANTIYFL